MPELSFPRASRTAATLAAAALQQTRSEALAEARRLARIRYDSGYSGYLDVLDADRNLFQSELDEVAARRDSLVASVDLIKSLGGGWLPGEQDTAGYGAAGGYPLLRSSSPVIHELPAPMSRQS